MDLSILNVSAGVLVGIGLVVLFMVGRILAVLTEIRDAARQKK